MIIEYDEEFFSIKLRHNIGEPPYEVIDIVDLLEVWEQHKADTPQTDIHGLTDCDFCKGENCEDCEGGKDEPQKKEVEWVYNKRERLWYPYLNGEPLFNDKPTTQTETQNSNLTFEQADTPQTEQTDCAWK